MISTIAIVSLSNGIIGEPFIKHELDIGLKRLSDLGLKVKFMNNAKSGSAYLKAHPEARASDLLQAFADTEADMILCAIGGDDTYRLLPYLFGNNELKDAVKDKIFLGFSDSTVNHFMLRKVGLKTFYGQSFLADICELGSDMFPYTRHYFEELINTGSISQITPSDVWYDGRTDFGVDAVGIDMPSQKNHGFELLQGNSRFEGEILGGCIDTIFDIFDNGRYADSVEICEKYSLYPKLEDWKGKILLLETSEEKPSPQKYRKMLEAIKKTGTFEVVSGILTGKPMDETYFDEYKQIIKEVVGNDKLPIVANINIGHATPRCIIPFGVRAVVDVEKQKITFAKR